MKFGQPVFNSRITAPGFNIGNNNVVSESRIPCATYPNVCGMGQSHNADLRISQSDAYTVTRTSNTRLTISSGTPWIADRLVGQWAFAYVNSTGLGSYVRVTANTTTTVDTDGVFYAGCDRVKFSPYLPKIAVTTNTDGAAAFVGCCFDGECVWFAPNSSSNIVKINVVTGVKTAIAHGEGASAFQGCCFDGENIWFAPYNTSNFVKVNVTTGVKTIVATHSDGVNAFFGCCFDGENVWFAPVNSANITKINVATGVKTTFTHGEAASAFRGCCFDGESVWFAPYTALNFTKINVTTNVKTTFTHGEGTTPFSGCCFDGESVWFSIFSSPKIIKINIATNEKIVVTIHSQGVGAFYGCCFDGENVWFSPLSGVNFVKVNVATGIKTIIGAHGEGSLSFVGCCFDGEYIWHAPYNSSLFIKTPVLRSGRASNYKPIIAGTGVFNTNLCIGTTTPAAKLQLSAGDAYSAPLKLTAGTNLTSPETGTIEYDGYFYYTGANSVRNLLSTYTNIVPPGNSYAGKKGQYTADAYYVYFCYENDLWKKIGITSW